MIVTCTQVECSGDTGVVLLLTYLQTLQLPNKLNSIPQLLYKSFRGEYIWLTSNPPFLFILGLLQLKILFPMVKGKIIHFSRTQKDY